MVAQGFKQLEPKKQAYGVYQIAFLTNFNGNLSAEDKLKEWRKCMDPTLFTHLKSAEKDRVNDNIKRLSGEETSINRRSDF